MGYNLFLMEDAEKRPSMKEQMDKIFKLKDRIKREFIGFAIDNAIAGISFAGVLSMSPFSSRYLDLSKALGEAYDDIYFALLAIGFTAAGASFVRLFRHGRIFSQMDWIQQDIRAREHEMPSD